jgi:glycosyltransferase involved in cell wall biosynthesis
VPPNDSVRLAEALMKLIRDPDLRNRLGSAAEQHVRAHFDMHRGLQTLVRFFEEALEGASERRMTEAAQ